MINEISFNLFSGLLPIVIAIIALISYLSYIVIELKIKEKIDKAQKEERNLSRADVKISLGYFHMHIYKTLYKEKTISSDEDRKAIREIIVALFVAKVAIKLLEEVKEKECFRQMFIAKNNLAFYLARKWNYYRDEKDRNQFREFLERDVEKLKDYRGDKGIAMDCMNYLREQKASGEYPELAENFEDTFIWVKRIFDI